MMKWIISHQGAYNTTHKNKSAESESDLIISLLPPDNGRMDGCSMS